MHRSWQCQQSTSSDSLVPRLLGRRRASGAVFALLARLLHSFSAQSSAEASVRRGTALSLAGLGCRRISLKIPPRERRGLGLCFAGRWKLCSAVLCCAVARGGPSRRLLKEKNKQATTAAPLHRCTAAPLHRCTATSWHLCLLFLGGGKWQAPAEPRLRGTAVPAGAPFLADKAFLALRRAPQSLHSSCARAIRRRFLLPTSPEDCLAKGDAQHLDARMPCVQALCTATPATRRSRRAALCSGNRSGSEVTFCRQENSVEDRPPSKRG